MSSTTAAAAAAASETATVAAPHPLLLLRKFYNSSAAAAASETATVAAAHPLLLLRNSITAHSIPLLPQRILPWPEELIIGSSISYLQPARRGLALLPSAISIILQR
jgi:hypothetical protein